MKPAIGACNTGGSTTTGPISSGAAFRAADLFGVAAGVIGVIPIAGAKSPASAKDGLRGGGARILSGPVEASLAKPRSNSLAMWRPLPPSAYDACD